MHLRVPRFLLLAIRNWATRRAWPYRPISNRDGTLYMNRQWVWQLGQDGVDEYGDPKPWVALRLHTIWTSDDGRYPHDHPWPFVTLLLDNAYIEHRPGRNPKLYRAGSVLFRRASTWHHLELLPDLSQLPPLRDGRIRERPVTTLFLQLPWRQPWGFLKNGRKIPYRNFLAQPFDEADESQQQGP